MKRLILVNGTMGAGKTTVCRQLKQRLPHCVFLDGDWCWDMEPFVVTEETKAMVLRNITYLLSQFLACTAYENILFCWVMHEESILRELLSRLSLSGCRVWMFSLVCSAEALRHRLQKDIDAGLRRPDILSRSLSRLRCYRNMGTVKIDTSTLLPEEAADAIAQAVLSQEIDLLHSHFKP